MRCHSVLIPTVLCDKQIFEFDDWKEEAQKSKDMEQLVKRLLDAPGTDADHILSPTAAILSQPASPATPKPARTWAHALVRTVTGELLSRVSLGC
jgi:hypothetical protein